MKPYCLILMIPAWLCFARTTASAQDSSNAYLSKFPVKYLDHVSRQTTALSKQIDKKSERLLRRLQRREARLQKIISGIDSSNGVLFFSAAQQKYALLTGNLEQKVNGLAGKQSGEYIPYYDSLKGSLSFLNSNKGLLSALKGEKLENALRDMNQYEGKLLQAAEIKQFINERRQQIQDMLGRYTNLPSSANRVLGKYKSDVYYYAAAVRDCKETFRDPEKMQRTALKILNKVPAFQQFMKDHSELSGLFSLPGNYGARMAIAGLQTRQQVQQALTTQLGTGANVSQVLSQQVQGAQAQLEQLKQKLNVLGGGSGDINMPDFKPNTQRTKRFLQRLEYGINMQSTKSSYFFPTTTDIALTVAYSLNDKNSAGIGASYKIGWGRDIKHIAFTSEGIGLRSFVDINIKKSFFATGGFEYNYQKPFSKPAQLYHIDDWQKCGLIGITKIVSVKSNLFKKTKLQLLWDFLSYRQRPRTAAIKFRVGYNF